MLKQNLDKFKNIVPTISMAQAKKLIDLLCHPGWYNQAAGFTDALSVAQTNNDYILAAFTKFSTCGYCKELKGEVFDNHSFGLWISLNGIVLSGIDLSIYDPVDKDLAARYNISTVPTVLALNPDGTERGRVVGYTPGTGVHIWLEQFSGILNGNTSPVPGGP